MFFSPRTPCAAHDYESQSDGTLTSLAEDLNGQHPCTDEEYYTELTSEDWEEIYSQNMYDSRGG
jgi:hypothetical protein